MADNHAWIGYEHALLRTFTKLFRNEKLSNAFKDFVALCKQRATNEKKLGKSNNTPFSSDDDSPRCNKRGVPIGSFNRRHLVPLKVNADYIKSVKHHNSCIPAVVFDQFAKIFIAFCVFRNKNKFDTLYKIRLVQASLPIAKAQQQIVDMLNDNQIIIVAGDTGCGKSTQIPQFLLQTDRYRRISCTQPRRIACTSLARRVAYEMMTADDAIVAHHTRFDRGRRAITRIIFQTEGILIRQMKSDPDLSQYDVIVLDEVHERNLSIDMLAAVLKQICLQRPELKMVVMSATINVELFSKFFCNAPIVKVPGRLYEIDVHYRPINEREIQLGGNKNAFNCHPYVNILAEIDQKYSEDQSGDVLIFLNGMWEITQVATALKEYAEVTNRWIILILHSSLSTVEQNKVFDIPPKGVRKCILSTNIAETSVTIDGIRFVIDSGKENLMRYDPLTRAFRLKATWISRASADQRKGRAGRTGPGVCYRLYSQRDYEKMEPFTLPEIKRVSLESVIMQVLDLNMELDVRDFEFIERPDKAALENAIASLKSHGIIEPNNEKVLTPLGSLLTQLPVDIEVGKMLICACVLDLVEVTLTVAAGLSVQPVFTNQSFRRNECIDARAHLESDLGDQFTLINVYREWIKMTAKGENTRKWCFTLGIEESRLYEINKLRRQLRAHLEQYGLIPDPRKGVGADGDSRMRRIMIGQKRKLDDLKKRVGERKSKVLKAGRHFDTIMEEEEEKADESNFEDDINRFEFSIANTRYGIENVLKSHSLNDQTANILQLIIAFGCYPQYAFVDPANSFGKSNSSQFFAHTPTTPNVSVHPNSTIAQMSYTLETEGDTDSALPFHQLLTFGKLLDTRVINLCNVCRMPANYLLLLAKNIVTGSKTLLCDEFIEFQYADEEPCEDLLRQATEIRYHLLHSIRKKLGGSGYGNTGLLRSMIVELARNQTEYKLRRRFVDPKEKLPCGIFTYDGDVHPIVAEVGSQFPDEDETNMAQHENDEFLENGEEEDGLSAKELELSRSGGREYFCELCARKIWFANNVEILQHKRGHAADANSNVSTLANTDENTA